MSLLKSIIKFYTEGPTDKQLDLLNAWAGTFTIIALISGTIIVILK